MSYRLVHICVLIPVLGGCVAQYARSKCIEQGLERAFPNRQHCLVHFENEKRKEIQKSLASLEVAAQRVADSYEQRAKVRSAQAAQMLQMHQQAYLQSQAFMHQSLLQHQRNLARQPEWKNPFAPQAQVSGGCGMGQVVCCRNNPLALEPLGSRQVALVCRCEYGCY